MVTIKLEKKMKESDFKYEPCPERYGGRWGRLVASDPSCFVWVRKLANVSRGIGSEFVVVCDSRAFGFLTAKNGTEDRRYRREDGTLVWCIDVIFHSAIEIFKDPKSGRQTIEELTDANHFESWGEQEKVISTLSRALSVYGAKGWLEPSPGEVEFSVEIQNNIESGAYIK